MTQSGPELIRQIRGSVEEVDPADVRAELSSNGTLLLDVREEQEWNVGHIPGARHVVLARILANPGAQTFNDRTIFACEVGERSAVASEMAVALGVKDVVNFRGGTKAWREAGEPLER